MPFLLYVCVCVCVIDAGQLWSRTHWNWLAAATPAISSQWPPLSLFFPVPPFSVSPPPSSPPHLIGQLGCQATALVQVFSVGHERRQKKNEMTDRERKRRWGEKGSDGWKEGLGEKWAIKKSWKKKDREKEQRRSWSGRTEERRRCLERDRLKVWKGCSER